MLDVDSLHDANAGSSNKNPRIHHPREPYVQALLLLHEETAAAICNIHAPEGEDVPMESVGITGLIIGGRTPIINALKALINVGIIVPLKQFYAYIIINKQERWIAKATTKPNLEQAAERIAAVVAAERPANRPTLKGLIHEDVDKTTEELCCRVQSLKVKLMAKNGTGDNKRSKTKSKKGTVAAPSKEAHEKEDQNDSQEDARQKQAAFSRCQQQRFQRRHQKSERGAFQEQVVWEKAREANRPSQIVRAAEWRVRLCFGFLPNLALSIHKNAQQVMGDTSPGCYFLKASNNTFHDLTTGAFLPPATATLLGLSLKFIPMPRYSPSKSDVVPSLDRFERNIGLKTFFAGHSNNKEIPKLQAKSAW